MTKKQPARPAGTLVGAKYAAEAAGIKLATFTAYVNRGQAPQPVQTLAGRRLYDGDEIDAWIANRPGRGARTDLKAKS